MVKNGKTLLEKSDSGLEEEDMYLTAANLVELTKQTDRCTLGPSVDSEHVAP